MKSPCCLSVCPSVFVHLFVYACPTRIYVWRHMHSSCYITIFLLRCTLHTALPWHGDNWTLIISVFILFSLPYFFLAFLPCFFPSLQIFLSVYFFVDHLCGLVVRVPGYRSRGLGSIPSATRFSEK
jgi:hypothetical protein